MSKNIGSVTLTYDENGIINSASFQPSMVVEADDKLLEQLRAISCPNEEEKIKESAGLVFGAWFNEMDRMETADREKYSIYSEVGECQKYPNGNVQKCVIKFLFKEVSS